MALTFTELEATTRDYFKADGGKAQDIYFTDSMACDYYLKKHKGLWERSPGGKSIMVPLEYDMQKGGFYTRSDALDSDDVESVNSAKFLIKHGYGNATLYRTDELDNAGEYAEVQLVNQRLFGAQKTIRKYVANNFYSAASDSATTPTGLRALTSETSTSKYGNIAEDDLVSDDATKAWEGKTNSTTETISLEVIQTLRSDAKFGNGSGGKPDVGFTTETLFNKISRILQVQQRFTTDSDTVKAGFTHVVYEGWIIVADDYCPSGYFFGINSNHFGFVVHKKGLFVRTPWMNLQSTGVMGRSLKILWDGNMICNNRQAHKAHSNLS